MLAAVWEIDEWIGLCEARSAREALRELYGPYIELEDTMPNDPEIDEAIRDRARGEAFQELGKTPVTFPATHWWWAISEI